MLNASFFDNIENWYNERIVSYFSASNYKINQSDTERNMPMEATNAVPNMKSVRQITRGGGDIVDIMPVGRRGRSIALNPMMCRQPNQIATIVDRRGH